MNKENNRGAAGLRRSAVAERIRLREEWSALKEVDTATTSRQADSALQKKPSNTRHTPGVSSRKKQPVKSSQKKRSGDGDLSRPALVQTIVRSEGDWDAVSSFCKTVMLAKEEAEHGNPRSLQASCDALQGVVAMVDVGAESKALPLRCALAALGATVVVEWNPLVTHLVWTDSGCRATRAKARALACKLVSPLWVEACAASNKKLNERTFPAASRQSDLPSPRTLRQLLKKAEMENVTLAALLNDSKEEDKDGRPRLRISSGTDTTMDSSRETIDLESRVNTAPRRGAVSPPTRAPPKSRRKLFTHKEAEEIGSTDDEAETPSKTKLNQSKLTQRERRDLARAERMARKLLAACDTRHRPGTAPQTGLQPKIVLTGMTRPERHAVTKAVQQLGGVIQSHVNKRTSHVLLGSCGVPRCSNHPANISGVTELCDLSKTSCWTDVTDKRARTCNALQGAARGCRLLHARWAVDSASACRWLQHHDYEVLHLKKISQRRLRRTLQAFASNSDGALDDAKAHGTFTSGAGSGFDSMKARVERTALGKLRSEYAYDVFYGMKVHLKPDAEQREAALKLLTLCGAAVDNSATDNNPENQTKETRLNNLHTQGSVLNIQSHNTNMESQNANIEAQIANMQSQNANNRAKVSNSNYDVVIGSGVGEVNSKWVFDSVAAARMRTTRRYINMNSFTQCMGGRDR
ncbi:unnamed protein product [Spodoptera littoralis]|uniref:BRCT domain-containing protein n=1 Tax=Spodoptera littoralis TaxID=7109 RepID=A0A9P0HYF4_SPOLI|nr:unnamed protein product [Spodoptera littoralis]CAH1636197.1 unnamed protein product [Spodoptera littoralis]